MRESTKLTPELKVTNLSKSLDFYINLAGFSVLYERPENKFAMIEREGVRIMLEELTPESRAWKVGKLEYPFGRGMHLQIEVSDINAPYELFKDNNYELFNDMEEKWYRKNDEEVGNKQFWVQDPDGYLLRFFQHLRNRPKE